MFFITMGLLIVSFFLATYAKRRYQDNPKMLKHISIANIIILIIVIYITLFVF